MITKREAEAIRVALPLLKDQCWHFGLRDDSDVGKRALETAFAVLKRLAEESPL